MATVAPTSFHLGGSSWAHSRRLTVPADLRLSAGEIFQVRSVANLVPPFQRDGGMHGTSAALEFAVNYLKVRLSAEGL